MQRNEYSTNVTLLRPPGHPRPPGQLGPRPYYQPTQDHLGRWYWYPEGSLCNSRLWRGPGKPPATFIPDSSPFKLPVRQAWEWPVPGYRSVS